MTHSFDRSFYDRLPISACIFRSVFSESGEIVDFEVVYGNSPYREEWRKAYPDTSFIGKRFLEDHILTHSAFEKIVACQNGKGESFSAYLPNTDRHLNFAPFRITEEYFGYFVTNITDYEEHTSRDHFLKNIRQLHNNAVLYQMQAGEVYRPVWVSPGFARMVEGTEEEALAFQSLDASATVHPDDYLLYRETLSAQNLEMGSTSMTVRKKTLKNQYRWVNIHISQVEDFHERFMYCTYFDVSLLKEHEAQLESMYEGIYNDFHRMGKDTLGTFRVNLTRDSIEEINGQDLFDTDFHSLSYTDGTRSRAVNYLLANEQKQFLETFSTRNLIRSYLDGHSMVSQVLYSRRRSGRQCFVNYSATLTRHPISGDIIAFITEQEYNSEKVNETILQNILVRQFDMICYIVNGQYGVVIGDPSTMPHGNIFPHERNGQYMNYIRNQVISAAVGTDEEKEQLLRALSLEKVGIELSEKNQYSVDITCDIEGDIYYKRFEFYAIDPEAHFYILLKSDFTEIQREQLKRNEQLKEALAEAKQASVAKSSFLSRMSHEIRTPMNAIIGLDTIALNEPGLTDNLRVHLEKIGSSARYLLSLINDILDMSRIESGRMMLKNESFFFPSFVEQVNTLIYSQCQDKNLTYTCQIQGLVDDFYIGDVTKLKQILINILGNAVKFTESPGSVSLFIERIAQTEEQSTLRFIAKDTGIGINPEFLPHMFEAFSQEDNSNTNSYGGSGLGLAISKNMAAMMNGDITVESQVGEGSTFTITVMLKNADTVSPDGENETLLPENMKVLIIDDEEVDCQHAQIILEEVGIASEYCTSPEEAIGLVRMRHARREDYDLILVDWKMPEKDGVIVTRELREILGQDTAIIILTAYNWGDIQDEAQKAGVDSFIRKPLFASSILEEFKKAALHRQSLGRTKEQVLADLNGRHVLLAEDMLVNAEIMRELCRMQGIEVEHAENGQVAVDLFRQSEPGHFDAVLMDVRMPVLDGLGATEGIRSLSRPDAKTVPIVAMTANAFDEDVQRSLSVGMDAHLSKPVEPDRLFHTLAMLIGAREQKR